MTGSVSIVEEPAVWQDLLQTLAEDSPERGFLEAVLKRLWSESGAPTMAIYLEVENGWVRELSLGEGRFPGFLAGEGATGFQREKLPGGLLLYPQPDEGIALLAPRERLLLAAGLRLLHLRRKVKQQAFERNYRGVELEALYDVGLAIASTLNLEELGEEILLRAVMLLDARRGGLYLIEDQRYRLACTFGGAACAEIALDDPQVQAVLQLEPPADQGILPGASHLLAVPVEVDAKPRGLLVVGDKESRREVGPFPLSDRRTLSLFANQAAIALENARLHRQALEKERLEREMELAADIQRRLLPKVVPQVPGFDLVGWSRPAQQIGGDYYDLIELPGSRIGLVVGDVSGKGMPAALMVSTLHSALRLLVDRVGVNPDLITRLNRHILESSAPNKFITFVLAELEPAGGGVQYLNAGHNPAVRIGADGKYWELPPGGMPLGLLPDSAYRAQGFDLVPGDLLCLYSDGVTESFSPEEEEFGLERLVELLREHRDKPLAEIVQIVDRTVSEFAHGRPQGDDQTLVLLRRHASVSMAETHSL